MRKMKHFIMKSSMCPCCFMVSAGARINNENLAALFEDLCSEKQADQQLYKSVNICYKCYTRLKLAFSYRKFFRDMLLRLKKNEPLPKDEVQSDVVDVPVVVKCPVCLIAHPTVQHVYEHLYYTQRSNGCDTNSSNSLQNQNYHYRSTQTNPYTGYSRTVPVVYRCSDACGASFARQGLLDVHQLMCRFSQLAYESSGSFCEASGNAAKEETISDFDESPCEEPSQCVIQKQSVQERPLKDVLRRKSVRKRRNATNRSEAKQKHTSPKEKQVGKSLLVKAANSDRIYYKKFCTICDKWFHKLNVHLRTHSASRHYECKLCHKSLAKHASLKYHESYCCPLLKNRTSSNAESKPFVCTLCGRSYRIKGFLVQHMKTHVKVPCSVCNKMISKTSVAVHMNTVHDNASLVCDDCGKMCKNRYALNAHIARYRQENGKRFECESCIKTFLSKQQLKVHRRSHEVGQKNYSCEFCGSTFFTAASLSEHIRTVHQKSKVQTCSVCGLILSSPSTLKIHERQHTGVKPYACDVCGKQFTQRPPLNRHLRSQHKIMPALVEKCPVCEKMFASKMVLKSHMVKTH